MNILRYCGDYPTKLKDADLALDVINAGLLNSTKIRTEIYLQLMKQQIMCDNPAR